MRGEQRMPVPNSFTASYFELQRFSFARSSVAASLTNTALNVIASDAASGSLGVSAYIAPFAGSIVGLTADLSGSVSAGSLTLTPAINGTAVAVTPLTPQVIFSAAGQDKEGGTRGQRARIPVKGGGLVNVGTPTHRAFGRTNTQMYV